MHKSFKKSKHFVNFLEVNDDSHRSARFGRSEWNIFRKFLSSPNCELIALTDLQAESIADALAKNTSVKNLTPGHKISCGAAAAKLIGDAIGTNRTINAISLRMSDGDVTVKGMADGLGKSQSLAKLKIRGATAGGGGAEAIGRIVAQSSTLMVLDISSNPIGNIGAFALAAGLARNISLKKLNARCCWVGVEGSKAIGMALASNNTLEELLWGTPAYEETEGGMQTFEPKHPQSLNRLHNAGAKGFAEGLARNKALKLLDLSWTDIRSKGAQAVGESLAVNSNLSELNLDQNSIKDNGMATIAMNLRKNTALQVLHLSMTEIKANGGRWLGEALEKNGVLATIKINHNNIGDEGAIAIGNGLLKNNTLGSLHLINCNILEEGALSIAKGLQTHARMRKIDLSGNFIGDVGASAIAQAIFKNRNLEKVFIGPALSIGSQADMNVFYCDSEYDWTEETCALFRFAIRMSIPRATPLKLTGVFAYANPKSPDGRKSGTKSSCLWRSGWASTLGWERQALSRVLEATSSSLSRRAASPRASIVVWVMLLDATRLVLLFLPVDRMARGGTAIRRAVGCCWTQVT